MCSSSGDTTAHDHGPAHNTSSEPLGDTWVRKSVDTSLVDKGELGQYVRVLQFWSVRNGLHVIQS